MKSLDVISSVDYGYRLVWAERGYLLRLAAVPMLVKLACTLIIVSLGWQQNFARLSILMLPAFFTEGWMLAHVTRLVFLGQRWPFRTTGNATEDAALLNDRAQGITAGMLFYVVTKFLLSGFLGILTAAQASAQAQLTSGQPSDFNPMAAFAAFGLIGATLWGFRFLFLYIPVSIGLGTRIITRPPHSFMLSLQMIGIWIICILPLGLLAMYTLTVLSGGVDGGQAGFAARLAAQLVQVFIDTLVVVITGAAIAAGLKSMLMNVRER